MGWVPNILDHGTPLFVLWTESCEQNRIYRPGEEKKTKTEEPTKGSALNSTRPSPYSHSREPRTDTFLDTQESYLRATPLRHSSCVWCARIDLWAIPIALHGRGVLWKKKTTLTWRHQWTDRRQAVKRPRESRTDSTIHQDQTPKWRDNSQQHITGSHQSPTLTERESSKRATALVSHDARKQPAFFYRQKRLWRRAKSYVVTGTRKDRPAKHAQAARGESSDDNTGVVHMKEWSHVTGKRPNGSRNDWIEEWHVCVFAEDWIWKNRKRRSCEEMNPR